MTVSIFETSFPTADVARDAKIRNSPIWQEFIETGKNFIQPHEFFSVCPHCGKLQDGVDGVGHDKKPIPGSFMVCSDCGSVNRLKNDFSLRCAYPSEKKNLDPKLGELFFQWTGKHMQFLGKEPNS